MMQKTEERRKQREREKEKNYMTLWLYIDDLEFFWIRFMIVILLMTIMESPRLNHTP